MKMSKAAMILLSMGMGIIANPAPRPAEAVASSLIVNPRFKQSKFSSRYNPLKLKRSFYDYEQKKTSFTRSTRQSRNSRNAIKKQLQKEANSFKAVWG